MKKIDKKGIVKLIILIILLIMQIKAFDNSRANKLTYITAKIEDVSGLLSAETSTMIAINEGDNGMAITLPNFINNKKINKYYITKKEIIQTDTENTEETKITPIPTEVDNITPTPVAEVTEATTDITPTPIEEITVIPPPN